MFFPIPTLRFKLTRQSVLLICQLPFSNYTLASVSGMSRTPQIISSEELPTSEAKWVTLKKIKFRDQEGREVCPIPTVLAYSIDHCNQAIMGSCREENARVLWR